MLFKVITWQEFLSWRAGRSVAEGWVGGGGTGGGTGGAAAPGGEIIILIEK